MSRGLENSDLPRATGNAPVDFSAEFRAAHRVLWTIAAGIVGRSSAADDVVQEAAMLALQKIDQFQPGTSFRAWMAKMVQFVALNHNRKQRKHRATSIEASPDAVGMTLPAPSTAPPLQLLDQGALPADQSHLDDRMVSALNGVQPIARACLLLRTIEQMDYAQIAKLLEIPEGTAMSHVHRTRQYLRERLAGMKPIRKEVPR